MDARIRIVVCALAMLLVSGTVAFGDLPPEDRCVKWSQPPAMVEPWGQDDASNHDPDDDIPNMVIADDWMCPDGQPIWDIHWWGSYLYEDNPIPPITGFYIGVHTDIPQSLDPDIPSHPGGRLKSWIIPFAESNEVFFGTDANDNDVYQYWVDISNDPFRQEIETIYWLVIKAIVADTDSDVWGWHTAADPQWIDDAVDILDYDETTGTYDDWSRKTFTYTPEGSSIPVTRSLDMAFELTTIPEPATAIMIISAAAACLAGVVRKRVRR